MGFIFGIIINKVSETLRISKGLVCAIYVIIGFVSTKPPVINAVTERELLFVAGIWAFAFVIAWITYGKDFWETPSSNPLPPSSLETSSTIETKPSDPAYKYLPQSTSDHDPANVVKAEPTKSLPAIKEVNATTVDAPANSHSLAKMIIEYSSAAREAWDHIESLPMEFQEEFLTCLEADTKCDALELAEQIAQRHEKLTRPYDDDDANEALACAKGISHEAETEFKNVYAYLEGVESVGSILDRVVSKHAPTLVPGLYNIPCKAEFRILPNYEISVFRSNISERTEYSNLTELLAHYDVHFERIQKTSF